LWWLEILSINTWVHAMDWESMFIPTAGSTPSAIPYSNGRQITMDNSVPSNLLSKTVKV